jgi:hypothetical protein
MSFLLRSGLCSIHERALVKLISKLRIEGKSVLARIAEAAVAVDAPAAEEDDEEGDDAEKDLGVDTVGKAGKRTSGLNQFLLDSDDEDETYEALGATEMDVVALEDDDDLFYEDGDGDNALREQLSSLITQTVEEQEEMEEEIRKRRAEKNIDEESDDDEEVKTEVKEEAEEEEEIEVKLENADTDADDDHEQEEEEAEGLSIMADNDDAPSFFNVVSHLPAPDASDAEVKLAAEGPSMLEVAIQEAVGATTEPADDAKPIRRVRTRSLSRSASQEPSREEPDAAPAAPAPRARRNVSRLASVDSEAFYTPVLSQEEDAAPMTRRRSVRLNSAPRAEEPAEEAPKPKRTRSKR